MKNITDFIKNCTDCWHTAAYVVKILKENGFVLLDETAEWKLKPGTNYCVMRNMSSVIAFKLPHGTADSFMIAATHGESPSFKIKAVPSVSGKNYIRLCTEPYGGMILSTWFDRPLSVSGRIMAETDKGLKAVPVRIDRSCLIIPSLAVHLDRDKKGVDVLRDTPPMYALADSNADFISEIAECANVNREKIKGFDLMLYNREEPYIWGKHDEFISSPRLDDLQCVYGVLQGFLNSAPANTVSVYSVFDNEEVGSGTKQGAKSDFLSSVLMRISEATGSSYSRHMQMLGSSFLVSADNAHAIHPNRSEMSDSQSFPKINEGIVIKYNASQRYTTDAVSEAIFKKICEKAAVPYQFYANRSDLPGGSTLGNLAVEKTSVNAVDIGLAQLAMHSATETAGTRDIEYLIAAMSEYYSTKIVCRGSEYEIY